MYELCFDMNECRIDLDNITYWKAYLSDGRYVLQDDDRPDTEIKSAWVRLGRFLVANKPVKLIGIDLIFGTHTVSFPRNRPAYYYSKGMMQGISQATSLDYHVIGYVDDDDAVMKFAWMKVPELIPIRHYTKPLAQCRPPSLILA